MYLRIAARENEDADDIPADRPDFTLRHERGRTFVVPCPGNPALRSKLAVGVGDAARAARSARLKTLGVFALVVATLEVSRALADRQLADDVLEQGIQTTLALLGNEPS